MGPFTYRQVSGIAYRATTYDTPLWASPNRRSGRWADASDKVCSQYCSLDPAAPLAEYLRSERIRDETVASELRIDLWELRLDESAVVDLSSPELASTADTNWADLAADDWTRCHEVARAVRDAGGRGIVAPSAALPGSLSITLFGPRSELRWSMRPVLAIQIPARRILAGRAGDGLLSAVRHYGESYSDVPVPDQVLSLMR